MNDSEELLHRLAGISELSDHVLMKMSEEEAVLLSPQTK